MNPNERHKRIILKPNQPSEALVAVAYQDLLLQGLSGVADLSLSNTSSFSNVRKKLNQSEKNRRKALQNIKPKVDSGRSKDVFLRKPVLQGDLRKEYVLDPLPKKPNLAQKIGLVPLPPQPLSDAQWKETKERCIDRDDFKNSCAICQDIFRLEDQVLLSCSHVFHKSCIQAFERFTGKKSCPMCRKQQYQSRVVYEGSKYYQQQCATKIQSVWRGFVVRKWYKNLRKTVPPTHPKLRKKFYEEKLHEITDRMVAMTSGENVDRLLNEIDESVIESRNIFDHFERTKLNRISEESWTKIKEIAFRRDDKECSICLQNMELGVGEDFFLLPSNIQDYCVSKTTILSCSHVFHSNCINSLEEFCFVESQFESGVFERSLNNNASGELPVFPASFKCPICRSLYVKKCLN